MQKFLVFLLFVFSVCYQSTAQNKTKTIRKESLSIGERVKFKSEILDEERIINIYLPTNYEEETGKVYPVIYLLDGSMDEDFIHIAGLAQFGAFPWIKMLPESIVVGISNTDRTRDFTFLSTSKLDQKEFPSSGKSSDFISFLEKELQPFIDSNYRTTNVKTIIGQSFGGLLATEILFKKPYLFNNYIIVSPSLWWNEESLLKSNPASYESEKSIFIAVGKEGEVMERVAKELFEKLKKLEMNNTRLYYHFLAEQNHGDALHLAVYKAFEKIFEEK